MKIKIWSDLHLEWSKYSFAHLWDKSPDDADTVLILAGDIGEGTHGVIFMEEMCNNFKHVVRICGNHEFYDREYNKVIDVWREEDINGPSNFHFLHNDSRIIDGVRFLGGTMWTSFDDGEVITMRVAHRVMSDYKYILDDNRKLITPEFVMSEHDKFINFIGTEFAKDFDGKTVVVTHHSPGNITRRRNRVPELTDYAYFAEIEHFIGWHDKASLWIHGHTHQNWDYMINNTRVVCNPYGYHNDTVNPKFDKNLIIEI